MADRVGGLYDLFVSYSLSDREWVRGYLVPALGLPAPRLVTPDDFRPGAPLVDELERVVTGSRHTLLVLSPAYLADAWSTLGEQLVSHLSVAERQIRLIPLLKTECELPLRLDFRVRLDCTAEANWESEIARLRAVLAQPEPGLERIPCPYPGMVPFSEGDARYFFGREREIEDLWRRLRHPGLTLVIGPSGSGKSSLIFAGLVPELHRRQPGEWMVRAMRPGATPLAALQAIAGDLPAPALQSSNPPFPQTSSSPSSRLLLVIDQFEELFASAKSDQMAFIAALRELCQVDACRLILTMRADFYPELMVSDLWPVSPAERLEVAPLRGAALREAIVGPAQAEGVYLETGLTERLLADAAGEPGTLPLLQETMALLWEKRAHRLLPVSAYERLGGDGRSGLATAIATKADATLTALPAEQHAIARRILVRLVQFGEGRPDTRRQQPVAELRAGNDPALFDQTLRHLVDNRLLTLGGEEGDPDRRADLAHEALIDGWPAFQRWLAERREAEQARRRLEAKAAEWARLGRGKAGLLDRVQLVEAQRWLAGQDAADLGYGEMVLAFVSTSRTVLRNQQLVQWGRPLLAVILVGLMILVGWTGYRLWLKKQVLDASPVVQFDGGEFVVGTNSLDVDESSHPEWRLWYPAFAIEKYEVSNKLYCLCSKAGGCDDHRYGEQPVCDPQITGQPVTNITVANAARYCQWLGRRLPTEIEWERAARGAENRLYPTGAFLSNPAEVNIGDGTGLGATLWSVTDVRLDCTTEGVVALAGNVSEWTISPWLDYDDPAYLTTWWPDMPETTFGRGVVVRGGSAQSGLYRALTSARVVQPDILPSSDVGFRCVSGLLPGEFREQVKRLAEGQ
ncbi:MAG: SUMF1/EgtB/PvdO family nonheme iron enzyme [Anaerolineae bacterium]|nr:SUMF1/EgtB/PvdO family nonheme iron enzyme [Anaerolineae bacterium]